MRLSWSFLFPFCLFHIGAKALAVNRTIDDTFGDSVTGNAPIYEPSDIWAGPECAVCAIKPDPKQAFNETWTAATYGLKHESSISIQLSFKGTAIYVFFIVPNYIEGQVTTETACNFTLDGRISGNFSYVPTSGTTGFLYNALVFSQTGLSNVDHTLLVSTSGVDRQIFVSFDYAIYTFDDTLPRTEAPPLTSGVTSTTITPSLSSPSIVSPSVDPSSSNVILSSAVPSSVAPSSTAAATQPSGTVSVPGATTQTRSVHKINVNAIVGSVVGGIAGLLVLIGIVRWGHLHQARTGPKIDTRAIVGSVFGGVTNLLHYCRRRLTATKVSTDHYAPTPFLLDGGSSNGSGVPLPKSISTPAQHTILDPRTDLVQSGTLHPTPRNHGRESMLQAYPSRNPNVDVQRKPLPSSRTAPSNESGMAEVLERLRLVQDEIERLRMQQQLEWERVSRSEPPPAY